VGSVIFADKEEILRLCWLQCGLKGLSAWIAYWSGGQAADCVGVVTAGSLQIFSTDISGKVIHPVYHRRVGLQTHASFQAVVKDPGNHRSFLGLGCFLFNHGGENDDIVQLCRAIWRGRNLPKDLSETFRHQSDEFLFTMNIFGEMIGIWKEIPFETVEITKAKGSDKFLICCETFKSFVVAPAAFGKYPAYFPGVETFRNSNGVLHRSGFRQFPDYLKRLPASRYLELSCLELASIAEEFRQQGKADVIMHNPGLCQFRPNTTQGSPWRKLDDHRLSAALRTATEPVNAQPDSSCQDTAA